MDFLASVPRAFKNNKVDRRVASGLESGSYWESSRRKDMGSSVAQDPRV